MDSWLTGRFEKFRPGISQSFRFGFQDCWPQLLRPLPIELAPDLVGRLADTGLLHEFPRHRGHQILVGIERLEAFA